MPVYNECATLEEILQRVQAVPLEKEIIVVDNCSTDGSRELMQVWITSGKAGGMGSQAPIRIIFQEQNRGKGSSVRRALDESRGEWVIIQDADLEYDPQDFLKLLLVAKDQHCEAVFGTRLLPGSDARQGMPKTSFYFGRLGLAWLFKILFKTALSDVATCYKLMKRSVAQQLELESNGFDLDFEIAAKLSKMSQSKNWKLAEVPISYEPRTELEGKKIHALRDGWRAIRALFKYRFI
ncbi:MAG: glycosyltransferase family 2 protein [Abditibacteriaceae bacterium]